MTDLLRLLPQVVAALVIAAFFLLAAVVLFGTIAACVRWRRTRRRAAPVRRLPEGRTTPIFTTPADRLTPVPAVPDTSRSPGFPGGLPPLSGASGEARPSGGALAAESARRVPAR